MATSSVSYGIIVTLAVGLAAVHAVSIANCPSGKFFHAEEKECVKCSSCPINQIIRLPCSKDRDTQCGPFKEFDKFHQAPVDSWEWEGEEDVENRVEGDLDNTSHDRHNRHHHQHRGHPDQGGSEGVLGGLPEDAEPLPHPSSGLARVGSAAVEGRWKTLALALIGVLCVVSLFLIIFIVVACYIKQRAAVEKEIILDPDLIAGHDQYVQVRHICSRDRLKGGPGQEGEDNSDSDVDSLVLPARGGPLLPRPVLRFSDEYDADSSAQSTAKSSDYVYFNSPNNANGVP